LVFPGKKGGGKSPRPVSEKRGFVAVEHPKKRRVKKNLRGGRGGGRTAILKKA